MTIYRPPTVALATKAANVSAETHAATDAVIAYGRKVWADARLIREMALGTRRIDLLFVMPADLVGVEIKGPKDVLDRLDKQLTEYRYWLPVVYAAVDRSFEAKIRSIWVPNLMWIEGATVEVERHRSAPQRDDLCCSRLLDLLWRDEAAAVAVRTGVIPQRVPKQFNRAKILSMLARLLTGHEITKEVCRALRMRTLVGMGSDQPVRDES